jgi:hypothetical protein
MLRAGRGQIVDELGLDWWDLISILIYQELEQAVLLGRLAGELKLASDLYATRPGWPLSGLGLLLKRPLHRFPRSIRTSRLYYYAGVMQRFSLGQLGEIFLDKYDPEYRWRSRMASRRSGADIPFVLLPSAYVNVSRMGQAYATILPEQAFLLAATRRSGMQVEAADNVVVISLAGYAGDPPAELEYRALVGEWEVVQKRLRSYAEIELLRSARLLRKFPDYLRTGLAVRNAWRNLLSQEHVVAVLCGDDSNPYTKLPVLLARQQAIPTVDFHHGALDGRFLLKELPSDFYLAKGEMERDYLLRVCGMPAERVKVGGPTLARSSSEQKDRDRVTSRIVFFSEPYEAARLRPADVYGELLPLLANLALEHGRQLVVKLHPFESRVERRALVAKVLPAEQASRVEVIDGPFRPELVRDAWFAVTVESTTVVDCSLLGVPCFLCEWLTSSSFEYVPQYARFGVGRVLESREQVQEIPRLLTLPAPKLVLDSLSKPIDPEWLRRMIAGSAVASPSAPVSKEK